MTDSARRHYFISYAAVDLPWVNWIAGTLQQEDLRVYFQEQDFRPGADFIHEMQQALSNADRTIAVLSPSYLTSAFGEAEWRTAFRKDPSGELGLLIPVRVEPCEPPGMLSSRNYIDIVGLDEEAARAKLLAGLTAGHQRAGTAPDQRPKFPRVAGNTMTANRRSSYPGRTVPIALDTGGHGSDQEQQRWAWLGKYKSTIPGLLGDQADLVGYRRPQQILESRLNRSDTATLVLLSGPAGSGKSSLLQWFGRLAGRRAVSVDTAIKQLSRPLRDDGSDVSRLLKELAPAVESAGDSAVLVYDDVDHQLRDQGITRLVRDAIAKLDIGFLVLATRTPITPQLFPIPVIDLNLDRRRADLAEFDNFLDHVLDTAGEERDAFSPDLRRSLHDLSEQTTNFRSVEHVIEMLLSHHRMTGAVTHPTILRLLLEEDPQVWQMQLPAVRGRKGPGLSFRRKDKSELLTEVILRHFRTPQELVDVAERVLQDFDGTAFLLEADQSFSGSVLSLCLTYSPIDLILRLLEPNDIQLEIDLLRLDPAQLLDDEKEKASLLVRGLGFTLVDTPKGLNDFKQAVEDAKALVENVDARSDVLNGAGKTVIQRVEAALLDLLHFWATYLFESVRDLVRLANVARSNQPAIDGRRLTTTEVVTLLRFLNTSAADEESAYRLSFPHGRHPVSERLLSACDQFARRTEGFESAARTAFAGSATPEALRIRYRGLVDAAAEVLSASDRSFPSVIKLSEIVFDEYSRKIFRGIDSDENEVRFALTDNDDREELVVAAHYFILPRKRVSVNPHIVPLGGGAPVLFDRAPNYDLSSTTQLYQGDRLLKSVHLVPSDSVIEVGSGTGALAIRLAERVSRIHGIDNSPGMVMQAEKKAKAAGRTNVTFELADLLDYDPGELFDVVISNSTMHWIQPEDRAYQQLYRLLRRGGRIGVHQGGQGNYRGLREHTVNVIRLLGYSQYYQGWKYPVYYPTALDYQELLEGVGFVDVIVTPEISNGSEYPNLVRDFSEAGLLPYLARIPDMYRDSFRAEWLEEAENAALDLYTHRLYAVGSRP